jgi:hypothetical protein
MAGRDRNDHHTPAARTHYLRANDGLGRVVSAFDDDVGLEREDQFEWRVLVEERDGVHRLERREDVCSLTLGANGPIGTLQPFDGCVTVHADNERFAARASSDENVDVSRMQEVEHAVREDDASGLARTPGDERVPRHDFSTRVEWCQYVQSAWGENRMSRTMRGISTRS